MNNADGDDVDGPTDGADYGMLAWETTDSGVDYTCPGFDVRHDAVRFPDGTDGEYHYVDEPPAVVLLPFTPDGDVVTIAEWRQAVGRVNRGLPAGTVETDDADLAAAAHRELREETGYVADAVEPLHTVEPANGVANSVHHYFLARDCVPDGDQRLDGDESIAVEVLDYDDALAAAVDGDWRDGRAVTALTYYELTRR
jgi:ADP-ribose pyrophosphatase